MWDIYDSHADGSDSLAVAYWELLAAFDYPEGFNDDTDNEPWAACSPTGCTPTVIDNEDGRSASDYRDRVPYSVNALHTQNCSP